MAKRSPLPVDVPVGQKIRATRLNAGPAKAGRNWPRQLEEARTIICKRGKVVITWSERLTAGSRRGDVNDADSNHH
jgi:hypothetical protein